MGGTIWKINCSHEEAKSQIDNALSLLIPPSVSVAPLRVGDLSHMFVSDDNHQSATLSTDDNLEPNLSGDVCVSY